MTTSLEDNTYWTLVQVAIRSKHDFAGLAELYDLSVMQLVTLCSLEPNAEVPMNRVSCFLGCDASNVTGIVDRLVGRGLIIRTESREDRRVKVIHLTDKGVQLRRHAVSEIAAAQPESMSSLTNEEFKQFNYLLKKALLSKPKAG